MPTENENNNLFMDKEIIVQILNAINLPILLTGNKLQIIYSSKQCDKLLDLDCYGKSVKEILHINPSITNIKQNLYSEKINRIVNFNPIMHLGKIEGFIVGFEESFEDAGTEKSKNTFRAAAHDLNNIFTNILNSIDLLKSGEINQAYQSKLLGIIENNSNRAADIISSQLRKRSDPDSFKSQIDINLLLDEISTSFKLFLPDRINFSTNIQYGLPDVSGNYTELYRSIYNLLINAKEAISDSGSITLHAYQIVQLIEEAPSTTSQKMICIRISDTGAGINEKDLPLIFNSQYSTKEKENISGIGLANVKSIIEKHKGKILATSKVGEGTIFCIHLPIIEKKKDIIVDEIKHLLIAEDEDTLRELLKDLFESHGFRVTAVKDGIGVIEEIKNQPFFDLLIIDKKMPNMDGLECITELNKQNSNVPIILATGSTGGEFTSLENFYKFTAAIQKPYKFDELLRLVNNTIL